MKVEVEHTPNEGDRIRAGAVLYGALLLGISLAGWDVAKALFWDQRFCGASLHLLLGASLVVAGMASLYLLLYGIIAVLQHHRGPRKAAFGYGLGWGIFVLITLILGLSEHLVKLSIRYHGTSLWLPGLIVIILGCFVLVAASGMIAARISRRLAQGGKLRSFAHTLHLLFPIVFLACGVMAGSAWYAAASDTALLLVIGSACLLLLPLAYAVFRLIQSGKAGWCMLAVVLVLTLPWLHWNQTGSEDNTQAKTTVEALAVPRVLLVVIDTLRPDALSCYGSDNPTPHIDALASEGILYTDAVATSPWTLPSVTTILSGQSTPAHGILAPGDRFPETGLGMAELFQGKGYHTGAVGFNPFLNEESGLAQGFDSYRMHPPSIFAAPTLGGSLLKALMVHGAGQTWNGDMALLTEELIAWLEPHQGESFFAWFHPYTPHLPYAPPKRFIPESTAWGDRVGFSDHRAFKQGSLQLSAQDKADFRTLYDAEVRYVDEQVGRLVGQLKDWGLYEDSLIIFTSDHGEEFWEHGGFEHGHTFYQELLHVPLIIKPPGQRAGVTTTDAVTLEDLLPTLDLICGLEAPAGSFTGLPLLDTQGGVSKSMAPRIRYATGTLYDEPGEAFYWQHYKYIRRFETDSEGLFDLQQDPGESESLIATQPAIYQQARELLEEYKQNGAIEGLEERLNSEDGSEIDKGSRELMQSLGYL